MLILKKLPQGSIYPQITQAPIASYADFLNFFRGGHTIDDNVDAPAIASTMHAAMLRIGIASRHLTKLKNMAIPDEFLADVSLTKSGSQLIQTTLDQTFCEMAIAEARKSIAEDDGELHPYVGVVVVKDGKILATGYRGESGNGDHGEYCALKKLNGADVQGATVYTTLEPCSTRKPPKKPCTERLIDGKVARVVSGMADKDESVYGHSSLVEAGIEIGFFPHDLMQELLALNKKWSDSRRAKRGVPPPNDTSPLANVSYYKLGTSMEDNTHFFVRPPKDDGGFYTLEDAVKNVLAYGRTIEEIAVQWHRMDDQKVIEEKLVRQSSGSSHRLLNLV
ncbi:MAG: deaminase [Terriglobales bacterium]